jgi:hypothetical protein
MPLKPIKVLDIKISDRIKDINEFDGYEKNEALIRLYGLPD